MSWSLTFSGSPAECKKHFESETSRTVELVSKEEEAVRDSAFALIDAAIEKNVAAKSLAIHAYGSQNSRYNNADKSTSLTQDVMVKVSSTL